mmetsp:Transcript_13003/g.23085  ORF Transcript_13003/g.23085 Transcript_13003/m.23085 type:complete len:122 (+) Transcript_13003:457-822(+)|eukprot:CAMPEP_0184523930 /NCGR_PEP_ID=MMETSP0198_2-20121128/9193_1 /TAXON_ID=1112570 /ORGANISM="Thraustochytrium sp., Strain LLF1b" /LENGTH=121 /DNA_ID=CAMNT_0026915087 /DNA_START=482 /DNA_END=847 /DNA_ORIENTATION=+
MSKNDGAVQLRFLFANHDGVSHIIEFSLDATADAVKQKVMQEWPDSVEKVSDLRRFRLLCMGKELETNSTKSLRALNIPVYAHPTPVNVSVLPREFETPTAEKPTQKNNMPTMAETCCIVM